MVDSMNNTNQKIKVKNIMKEVKKHRDASMYVENQNPNLGHLHHENDDIEKEMTY